MTAPVTPFSDPRRAKSEELAAMAERAWAAGSRQEAETRFAEAAELEEAVAREVPDTLPRARSILAISAVALWYKAAHYDRAKRVAYGFLASSPETLTIQGRAELEALVDRASRES